jgi:hypothetical protein
LSKVKKMERLVVHIANHCLVITSDNQSFGELNCLFHADIRGPLQFSVGWSNGLHWKRCETPPLILNQGPQTCDITVGNDDGGIIFRVTYEAQKRFNPLHRDIMATGFVTSIKFMGTLQEAWKLFERDHGHRIVCKLRLGVGALSCQTYLSRAQIIVTSATDGERTYVWRPKEDADGSGFPSPRTEQDWETHAREARELALLKPTSPRSEPAKGSEVDHDGFKNEHRVLPIAIRSMDKEVQLQFFNLRGGYVESSHVAWPNLKPQRRSLRTAAESGTSELAMKLTPNMTAFIQYEKGANDCIKQVTLVVKDYDKTLVQMGEGLPPKTI